METRSIKDFIHLYLGCEVVSTAKKPGTKRYILSAITKDGLYEFNAIPEGFSTFLSEWKPVLRPLSDMTEEETLTAFHMSYQDAKYQFDEFQKVDNNDFGWRARNQNGMECFMPANSFKPDVLLYLLKQGFDLFGLIESGLAIDKTKL